MYTKKDQKFDKDRDIILEAVLKVFSEKNPNYSEKELEDELETFITTQLDNLSDIILMNFHKEKNKEVKKIEKYENGFNRRLKRRWKIPIQNLTYFIHRNISEGNYFNSQYRDEAVKSSDYKFEAIVRIHGQACLISSEVLCLLKNGFADAAISRWRTLYENTIYAMFINDNDQETAKRYLEYNIIDSYNREQNNPNNTNPEYLEYLTKQRSILEKKYGKSFLEKNGWYAHIISNKNKRNLYTIECKVKMNHMNYWYKIACIGTHAGSESLYNKLSMMDHIKGRIILSGPSNYGLSLPGQNVVISLTQITCLLLLLKPNFDRIITCNAILKFGDEILQQFNNCQLELEKKEKDLLDKNAS
jgi:hypothetical protein